MSIHVRFKSISCVGMRHNHMYVRSALRVPAIAQKSIENKVLSRIEQFFRLHLFALEGMKVSGEVTDRYSCFK